MLLFNCCLTVQEKKTIFFSFSSVFSFKQAKEFFFVSGATFKNVKKWFANFRVTVNIFWGPTESEKATVRHDILELGSYNHLAQHRKWYSSTSAWCFSNCLSLDTLPDDYHSHRRRITVHTEEKAKVVASVWGPEFNQFLTLL